MRTQRWVLFILVILAGIGLGLYYGWVVSPVQYVDTAPNSLRADYKTDYVLMVAEAYQVEGDLARAVRRLALLGGSLPDEIASQGLLDAQGLGYSPADLALIRALRDDLLTWNPALEAGTP